jgi:hypothetical protein
VVDREVVDREVVDRADAAWRLEASMMEAERRQCDTAFLFSPPSLSLPLVSPLPFLIRRFFCPIRSPRHRKGTPVSASWASAKKRCVGRCVGATLGDPARRDVMAAEQRRAEEEALLLREEILTCAP